MPLKKIFHFPTFSTTNDLTFTSLSILKCKQSYNKHLPDIPTDDSLRLKSAEIKIFIEFSSFRYHMSLQRIFLMHSLSKYPIISEVGHEII